MFGLGELIQGLHKSFSGSIQGRLRLWIIGIAFRVDLVTASAEIISREKSGYIYQQIGREVNGVRGSDAKLARGWFVSI